MNKQIFVNLAVKDLEKSKAFFAALGFTFNPQFTSEHGAGMVIADGSIYAMLVTQDFFKTLTTKKLVNAHESVEALFTLGCESREEVDSLMAKAVAAGGKAAHEPEDLGFMYSHGFYDLDGHSWGLVYMKGSPPA